MSEMNVLADYREQKKKTDKLAADARKQMTARYAELLNEAATIQVEFRRDFGEAPGVPASIKTFTLVDGNGKKKQQPSENGSNGKKIGGLRRTLAAAIKNGDQARVIEVTTQLQSLGVQVEEAAALTPAAQTELVDVASDESGIEGL